MGKHPCNTLRGVLLVFCRGISEKIFPPFGGISGPGFLLHLAPDKYPHSSADKGGLLSDKPKGGFSGSV